MVASNSMTFPWGIWNKPVTGRRWRSCFAICFWCYLLVLCCILCSALLLCCFFVLTLFFSCCKNIAGEAPNPVLLQLTLKLFWVIGKICQRAVCQRWPKTVCEYFRHVGLCAKINWLSENLGQKARQDLSNPDVLKANVTLNATVRQINAFVKEICDRKNIELVFNSNDRSSEQWAWYTYYK